MNTAPFCKDQSVLKPTVINSHTVFHLLGFHVRPPDLGTTDTMIEVPFRP